MIYLLLLILLALNVWSLILHIQERVTLPPLDDADNVVKPGITYMDDEEREEYVRRQMER